MSGRDMKSAPDVTMTRRPLRSSFVRFGGAITVISLLTGIIAPKGIAWWFPLLIAIIPLAYPTGKVLELKFGSAGSIAILCGIAAGLMLVGTAWSADRISTLIATGLLVLYLGTVLLAQEGLRAEKPAVLDLLSRGLVTAVGLGAVYLVFELLTGSLLQRLAFTYLPLIRPASPQHVGIVGGRVVVLVPDELNRGVAFLNLLLWPAIMVIVARASRRWLALGLLGLAATATFLSAHESSKLAILCATVTLLLWKAKPCEARIFIATCWAGAVLAVVPVATLAYRAELHMAEWLPVNAKARVIIGAATAEQVARRPLLGVGADSTRLLNALNPGQQRPGHVVRWRTGVHAHNVYLQTWYELGAAGAAVLLALGLAIIGWIALLPALTQPFAAAAFASAAVIAGFTWSIWQPWFLASLFLASVVAMLAVERASRG